MEKKKYFLKGTVTSVNIGDRLSIGKYESGRKTPIFTYETTSVAEEDIEMLLKLGIIEEQSDYAILYAALKSLADKQHWSTEKMASFLGKMCEISEAAVFETILKEIALLMDKSYPDNIRSCKLVYGISKLSLKVVPIFKEDIKHYGIVALFRTEEEAKRALDGLKEFIDYCACFKK